MIIMALVMVFGCASSSFAISNDDEISDMNISGEEFDADEPEIEAPATENEYLVSDSVEEIDANTPVLYAVTPTISFKRTAAKQVKSSVTLNGSSSTTKLVSKVYLLKKVGSDYKYTGKKSTKSYAGKALIHKAFFSVEKEGKYKIKVVITEYRGKTVSKKAPIYILEK